MRERQQVVYWVGITLMAFGMSMSGCTDEPPGEPLVLAPIEEVLSAAGNSGSEQERYSLLSGLLDRSDLEPRFRSDLDQLLRAIDRWANGREKYWEPGDQELAGEGGYLGGFFVLKVWPFDDGYPHQVDETSPLYPIRALYRGRMLIWNALEMGVMKDLCYEDGRDLLQIAADAYPDNPVIPMYLGQPVVWPALYEVAAQAPEWAVLEREALGKLRDIISFWVNERQAPDGQFGGGWGDDVEMWRHWTPLLVGFDEPEFATAQRSLSEALFALPRLEGGYTNILIDVEHSAEDTADTITSMLHLFPQEAVWQSRALNLAELMANLWTDTNQRGFRHFKSTYFTATEVDPSGALACDTPYHARAAQPLFLYWQRTGDERVGDLIQEWLRGWVDATARASRGKPAGVVPAAIGFPSGEPAGPGADWWNPGCHITDDLFVWPRGLNLMMPGFLLSYVMTGDETFLDPIRSMTNLRLEYLSSMPADPEEGSSMWVASALERSLRDVLAKYRLATESLEFDELLNSISRDYTKYILSQDESVLLDSLASTVDALGYNEASFKQEVRFSDRVFAFRKFSNELYDTNIATHNATLLYGMVTGDFGDPLYLPLNAVKWETTSVDLAVRVEEQRTDLFHASLYHFGTSPRPMGASFLRLEEGRYRWQLSCDEEDTVEGTLDISSTERSLGFTLPAQKLCVLELGLS